VLLAVIVVIAAAAGILLAKPFSHSPAGSAAAPSAGASSPPPSASASGTGTASAAPVTERQAATTMATMLAQSVSERSAIISAAADVASCGSHLASDQKVFTGAVSSRKALLTRLAVLPGRAALPSALVSDLASAWQASVSADQGYARWAADESAKGCVRDDTSDPGYQAAQGPDGQATRAKTAFTAGWNPVAARYGLTQYQSTQL
jgi:hypothetical protein